jgi:hypothetical protein
MRRSVLVFGLCLCGLLTCLLGDDEQSVRKDPEAESYVLTKNHLIALQRLCADKGSLTNASTGAADPVGFEMVHYRRPPGDAGRSAL